MGGGTAGGLWRYQQWSPSWILTRTRNEVKTARNGNFLCSTWKVTKSTLHDFSQKICFHCWNMLKKKKVFSPKNGLTTCHLWHHISYHSNWPSIKLSQNVRKGWTNSYWKRRLLMFYPLGKKLRKTLGEGGSHWHQPPTSPLPPPPLDVQGLPVRNCVIIFHYA